MSDEERKAIDYLQFCYDISTITNESLSKLGIVLNLIEKQQKEIEELKEKNKFLNWYFENQKENFIHKDKIKAKIEELEIIADNGANAVRFAMTHEDEIERIQKQKDIGTMVEILQSLLEKE